MDILRRQVHRALRRLLFEQFLRALGWCWTATLLAAAVGIAVEKYYPLGVGTTAWLIGGASAGLVLALGWTWLRRRRALDAAIEIDRRYGLKERVSSSWALDDATRETPVGQALIADAARRVERLRVGEHFRIRLGRWSLLPLGPAVAAFLVAWLINPVAPPQAIANQEAAAAKKQIKATSTTLEGKLAERKKKAEEEGLESAKDLFAKLEKATRELAEQDKPDRKKALVGLNDLAKDLEERRKELAGSKELKEQLNQMEKMQEGPADRLADAVREGDFDKAREEIEKLRQKLENGELDQAQQEQLAQQMQQMADKLDQMAKQHQAAQEALEKQIAQAEAEGRHAEANQLREKLAGMKAQSRQMQQAQKMAQQCQNCANAMQQGDGKQAAEALAGMEGELSSLAQEYSELESLDEAMNDLADAKNSMNCKQCQGAGCEHCNGGRQGDGQGGLKPGHGVGRNKQPGDPLETNTYDTTVRQRVGRGGGVVVGEVNGPTTKGGVEQEIQSQFDEVGGEEEDPLTGQRLPRGYREHAQKYFDSLREGN